LSKDIAQEQAQNPQNQMEMKLKTGNKLLNNSKQPDSRNDWSNILMIKNWQEYIWWRWWHSCVQIGVQILQICMGK